MCFSHVLRPAWPCTHPREPRNRHLRAGFVIKERAVIPQISLHDSLNMLNSMDLVAIWGRTSHASIWFKLSCYKSISRAIPSPSLLLH